MDLPAQTVMDFDAPLPQRFDGETFDVDRDSDRLGTLQDRVKKWVLKHKGEWFTLATLIEWLDVRPESAGSVSARVRDLRKKRFGGFTVESRFKEKGLWEYRVS
ncbi:MAG: hypothetical protein JWO13_804 [Acidobacteriales bacterium]|nr:hypothetical protein [Terriglobales bacterium]